MTERYQVPTFLAAMIGFISFAASFVVLVILFFDTWAVLHPVLHLPDHENAQEVAEYLQKRPDDTTVAVLSFLLAVVIGVLTHRAVRSPVTPNVFFQTSFFAGFGLLSYSLWVVIASFRILCVLTDDSLRLSGPASTLLICIVTIPSALLLLLSALLVDSRQFKSVRGPASVERSRP